MNPNNLIGSGMVGLVFVLVFFGLMVVFSFFSKRRPRRLLREIPAFARLDRSIGLAVEAGQRLHVSLGWGDFNGLSGASALLGLVVLQRIARVASISDRPPLATSGEGTLAILARDSLKSAYQTIDAEEQYSPEAGQLAGLTPFGYAAGTLPVIADQQVAANFLAGHFNSEVALITDAAERNGSLSLAGSDSLTGQAVLYASAQEPLIGEELYAAGAYVQAGVMHIASLRAEDVARWVIVLAILGGVVWKLLG